ncbi:MAG: 3'-5' exonuclease [Chthonomonadales bacterium]|nr:3'-5' exonuclease [Chthonomonadales bacterium]
MSTALARIKEIVPQGDFVILDTETTGIDYRAEIVQIGMVDANGTVLLDSFVRPTIAIPPDATAIHGITDSMVADAPRLSDLADTIRGLLKGRPAIVYNAEYDMRLLSQSSRALGLAVDWQAAASRWICAMLAYAEHRGVPGRRYGEFRWHRLGDAARFEGIQVANAHAAVGDCLMTLALVRKMAGV